MTATAAAQSATSFGGYALAHRLLLLPSPSWTVSRSPYYPPASAAAPADPAADAAASTAPDRRSAGLPGESPARRGRAPLLLGLLLCPVRCRSPHAAGASRWLPLPLPPPPPTVTPAMIGYSRHASRTP
ncbi:unnamed protein product, partial [Ectocarpus sp. 12 AP-2014]